MLKAKDRSSGGQDVPTLTRELEVTVSDEEDLRKMLAEILTGRQTVTVFDAYEPDQSISLSIVGTKDLPGIRLRARVIEVQKSHSKEFGWANLYTLTLEFEHPRKEIRSFVKLLLGQMNDASRRSELDQSEVPDWIRNRAAWSAAPEGVDKVWMAVKSNVLSTLESDFPESVNYLVAGWGDVDAFETLFSDLVLGDHHGLPGGWPADAWEELEFLQRVHDQAYGVSKSRGSTLRGGRVA